MIHKMAPAARLRGEVVLPGDKSISHRYALLAAIAAGTSTLKSFPGSEDCRDTLRCLTGLGVAVDVEGDTVRIEGASLHGLSPPDAPLDAGNSGTTLRLLAGILAGQPWESVIGGDASLSRRPMARIITPLRSMGATVESRAGDYPPLTIRGGSLRGIRYPLPVASAQVKSCVLLAGLYADTPTFVREAYPTRDHTEIALRHFGAEVRQEGEWIGVKPGPPLRGAELEIPGDLSAAAFFIVGAAIRPGSSIFLGGVGLNRRRCELVRYLQSAGLGILVERETCLAGEFRGDLRVQGDREFLNGALPPIAGETTAALIDEIPILAVLGACMKGGVVIRDAAELRVKECDRLAALAENLRAMGARVEEKPDGLNLLGGGGLHGAEVQTRKDHRIAMAFSMAALAAEGETRISDAESVKISFPRFYEALSSVVA